MVYHLIIKYKMVKKNLIGSGDWIVLSKTTLHIIGLTRTLTHATTGITMIARLFNASTKPVGIFLLTILAISTLNWAGIHFMATHCATWGWLGPFRNLLSLGSPVCMFVNHVQVALADYYITIWASAATATIAWITARFTTAGQSKNT